jgi:ankyrin repeat protein
MQPRLASNVLYVKSWTALNSPFRLMTHNGDTERAKHAAWTGDLSSLQSLTSDNRFLQCVVTRSLPRATSELQMSTWGSASALDLAVFTMQTDLVSVVLEDSKRHGVNFSLGALTLRLATANNDSEMLNILLQSQASGVSLNWIDKMQYRSPMHIAAEFGHVEAIRVLRSAGATVDLWDYDAKSKPIHLAAMFGRAGAVVELALSGAKISEPNYAKLTPLHLAAREGHIAVIEVLLTFGASCLKLDEELQTPLDLARKYGHREAEELLIHAYREAGGRRE